MTEDNAPGESVRSRLTGGIDMCLPAYDRKVARWLQLGCDSVPSASVLCTFNVDDNHGSNSAHLHSELGPTNLHGDRRHRFPPVPLEHTPGKISEKIKGSQLPS